MLNILPQDLTGCLNWSTLVMARADGDEYTFGLERFDPRRFAIDYLL